MIMVSIFGDGDYSDISSYVSEAKEHKEGVKASYLVKVRKGRSEG